MKKLALITAFFATTCYLHAQEEPATETLFSGLELNSIGAMAEGWYGLSQLGTSDAHLLGARAGVVFNNQLTLGGFFQQSVNQIDPKDDLLPNDVYLDFWTAGGFLEYTLAPTKLVHLSFPLYVGYGEVQLDDTPGEIDLGEANFLVIEPGALMQINLLESLKFNLGAGYRFTSDVTYGAFDQNDIQGLRFHCGLRFVLNKNT